MMPSCSVLPLVAGLSVVACGSASSPSEPGRGRDAPAAPVSATPSARVDAAGATPARLPALAELTRLVVTQHQGGPSLVRCDGVVFEITIDLATGSYRRASCAATGTAAEVAAAPLAVQTTATLDPARRRALADAYAKLTIDTSPSCAHDGGALTLTLTRTDGRTESFVDENWGCRRPPPVIAAGLDELTLALAQLAPP